MHAVVFPAAAAVVILWRLISICFVFPTEELLTRFQSLRDGISHWFGWLYVGTMSGFLLFAAFGLPSGATGKLRLGADDASRNSAASLGSPCCSARAWGSACFSIPSPNPLITSRLLRRHTVLSGGPDRLAMAMTVFPLGFAPVGALRGGWTVPSLLWISQRHATELSLSAWNPFLGIESGDDLETASICWRSSRH